MVQQLLLIADRAFKENIAHDRVIITVTLDNSGRIDDVRTSILPSHLPSIEYRAKLGKSEIFQNELYKGCLVEFDILTCTSKYEITRKIETKYG